MKRTKNFFIALLGFCLMGSGVMAQTYYDEVVVNKQGLTFVVYENADGSKFVRVKATSRNVDSYEIPGSYSYEDFNTEETLKLVVIGLEPSAFSAKKSLVSVSLPATITDIPESAFNGCEALEKINLENIKTVGVSAFQNCKKLGPSLDLSKAVSVGASAFQGCECVTTLTIGDVELGNYAFLATKVSDLIFVNVTTIPAGVATQFAGTLTSVTVPGSATAIADKAFMSCSGINRFQLGSVTSIGAYAFSGCTLLKNITLTDVKSIGDYAFQNCSSLSTADLLSVESLGKGVFEGALNMSEVAWPSALTTVPNSTFDGCEVLESVYDAKNSNPVFGSLTEIGDNAFKACYALAGVVEFSQSLTKIGDNAFQGVANVNEFKFKSNPAIGTNAFGTAINKSLYLTDDNVAAAFSGNSNTFTNVYYTRVIPTSESGNRKYAGLVLPFVPVANDDYVYHKLAEVNGNELIFETSNTASANVPYLFENRSDNTTVTITGQNVTFGQSSTTDVVESVGDWKAIGVYETQTVSSNKKCYAISGGDFTQYVNNLTVKPYRAYWKNEGAAQANFMLRTSRGDVTAIKMAELDGVALPAAYYDLTGRMVNNPVKGNIYIVNGKKVVF